MGIIFIKTFLDYFSDESEEEDMSRNGNGGSGNRQVFECFHYNGRPEANSSTGGIVKFSSGTARVIDWQRDSNFDTQIEMVLQTKWKNVQVEWSDGAMPSIS